MKKELRLKLNDLSFLAFGSTSKWQKILKDPRYMIHEETDQKKLTNSVYLGNSKKNQYGTIMKSETAKKKGLLASDVEEQEIPVLKSRSMTEEELVQTLENVIDSKLLDTMREDEIEFVYAKRSVDKTLRYSFGLQKKISVKGTDGDTANEINAAIKEYDEGLDELLIQLDEPLQELVKSSVVSDEVFKKTGGFDAKSFAESLIEASNVESVEKYEQIMSKANDNLRTFRKMGILI